ncbi:Nop14 nucleolar protein [Candida orthopsilosis Co 90-125]|uniref:Nop14 nucleolar protein n=1 Tax=Candida orthopsilosis (strain 90-125) TaxID=1136231 RepID=H8X305_CANO9|nr:Nop14 nucleolar protein [Candida orthopsilosis Co 90-125]CCG25865.1 Nop14 nucleolar protein [Candida orthopsilosis Co 90-125]
MAGSQLKQLKSALKEKGLIGQTNTNKKKSAKSKTSRRNEVDRDLRQQNLHEIRDQFNKFDQRINRTKHDITIASKDGFVKVGSKQHNAVTAKNGAMQKQMKMQYDLEKQKRGRTGGVLDKRFGENDSHLTQEEKMLARFTKERQAASSGKKKGLYSLQSDNEEEDDDFEGDDGGFQLTHSGQALSLDDEETIKYVDEDQVEEEEAPPRKKSKNEVMKEIIAKSKFYKQQRQQTFAKTQDQIEALDDDFGDIMQDLRSAQGAIAKPAFSQKAPEDIEYDNKVRELTYDRRAAPADRTKTEEELRREHEEKMKKLEQDRLKRMEGFNDREAEADDLDGDGFWGGDSENEENGFSIKSDDEDGEKHLEEEGSDEENITKSESALKKSQPVLMPTSVDDFIEQMELLETDQQASHIKKICESYKPNLAMGNKEKMNQFVSILFEYVMHLADSFQPFESIVKVLKNLANTYNQELVERMRSYLSDIETRSQGETTLKPRDLIYFVIVAMLFSTSDHYHLIVTPSVILMNQILSNIVYHPRDVGQLAQGVLLVDVLLQYQRFSKRYDPESVNFIEHSIMMLVPESEKFDNTKLLSMADPSTNYDLPKSTKFTKDHLLSIKEIFTTSDKLKSKLLIKLINLMDKSVKLWRDKSSLVELLDSYIAILKHIIKYTTIEPIPQLLTKFTNLHTQAIKSRKPLTLHHHKSIAIATYAPKFEENFNPDKKSYDENKDRQELAKVRQQLKKEKKAALKDIRYENRFVAREQIDEKKKMYDEYHRKMAKIVNTIQADEGAEKNQYEREKKKQRK